MSACPFSFYAAGVKVRGGDARWTAPDGTVRRVVGGPVRINPDREVHVDDLPVGALLTLPGVPTPVRFDPEHAHGRHGRRFDAAALAVEAGDGYRALVAYAARNLPRTGATESAGYARAVADAFLASLPDDRVDDDHRVGLADRLAGAPGAAVAASPEAIAAVCHGNEGVQLAVVETLLGVLGPDTDLVHRRLVTLLPLTEPGHRRLVVVARLSAALNERFEQCPRPAAAAFAAEVRELADLAAARDLRLDDLEDLHTRATHLALTGERTGPFVLRNTTWVGTGFTFTASHHRYAALLAPDPRRTAAEAAVEGRVRADIGDVLDARFGVVASATRFQLRENDWDTPGLPAVTADGDASAAAIAWAGVRQDGSVVLYRCSDITVGDGTIVPADAGNDDDLVFFPSVTDALRGTRLTRTDSGEAADRRIAAIRARLAAEEAEQRVLRQLERDLVPVDPDDDEAALDAWIDEMEAELDPVELATLADPHADIRRTVGYLIARAVPRLHW